MGLLVCESVVGTFETRGVDVTSSSGRCRVTRNGTVLSEYKQENFFCLWFLCLERLTLGSEVISVLFCPERSRVAINHDLTLSPYVPAKRQEVN